MANTTSQRRELQRVETVIKKVKLVQKENHEELKITTENGTRCTISSKDDEYRYAFKRWKVLCHCLSVGDTVEITNVSGKGKIIHVNVDLTDKFFSVVGFRENEQGIFLNCRSHGKDEVIEIQKADIRSKTIICENEESKVLDWEEIFQLLTLAVKTDCIKIRVFYLNERLACVHFLET